MKRKFMNELFTSEASAKNAADNALKELNEHKFGIKLYDFCNRHQVSRTMERNGYVHLYFHYNDGNYWKVRTPSLSFMEERYYTLARILADVPTK